MIMLQVVIQLMGCDFKTIHNKNQIKSSQLMNNKVSHLPQIWVKYNVIMFDFPGLYQSKITILGPSGDYLHTWLAATVLYAKFVASTQTHPLKQLVTPASRLINNPSLYLKIPENVFIVPNEHTILFI